MRRALLICLLLAGCGGGDPAPPAAPAPGAEEAAAGHIHGVGVDPGDGALYVATHAGLFRAAEGEARAARVGTSRQDTMGFTVTSTGEFLGSGHPDSPDQPPLLGLIRSTDGGRSWRPISLSGEADFHVLRAAGPRVYGVDASSGRLLASEDGGRSWDERRPPAPVIDLAIDPEDGTRIVASTQAGLSVSRDGGERWRPLDRERAGLLAWTGEALVLVDGAGETHRSRDGGRTWERAGAIGGRPAALSADGDTLHAGTHDNRVMASADGGRTWTLRATL